ncbi:hypothetical protein GN958_ATG10129 [Phytophthora infestans]|uniref:Uncharacterized protein n=1 Tax=Phytophthora infestans TaxID=4787 RepID=A0A8S9UML2_PHYIN|nr:hypothetical protein GN958_ATG10129 [Phytophthora infestans]
MDDGTIPERGTSGILFSVDFVDLHQVALDLITSEVPSKLDVPSSTRNFDRYANIPRPSIVASQAATDPASAVD